MGRENMEDYNADFLCMLETWEAAVKFRSPTGERKAQPIEIARLLGWTLPSTGRSAGTPAMSDTPPAQETPVPQALLD
jgi:hypothetical protein